jgi:hypothetical protein
MQSIHVSASTLQRIKSVLGWAMPPASIIFSGLALGYRWFGNRASIEDVSQRIAPVAIAASAAQAESFHCSSVLRDQGVALDAAWAEVVALHAELEVYRRYSSKDAGRRGQLIEEGTRFFRAEYDRQLELHPHDPAKAAARALLADWRPH